MRPYKIKDARVAGQLIGRAGLSQRVIQAVNDFDGSYKGAMQLAGRLSVIADMSTFDSYWEEKTYKGIMEELENMKHVLSQAAKGE